MEEKKEKGTPTRVGPLLRQCLDKQRESIKRETYDVCESSDYEAGEILAKKLESGNLI